MSNEEKKLTVEEIIYDLKVFSNLEIEEAKKQGAEKAVLLATLTLELIQTLQAEKEEIKNEYVKLDLECQKLKTENEELKSNKFANWKVKFFKAQEEIERLTEERDAYIVELKEVESANEYANKLLDKEKAKNAELQKQVDELLNRRIEPKIFHCNADALGTCPKVEQAVKDTAKEILQSVGDIADDGDDRFKYKDYQWHKRLCERYGV